MTKGSGSWSPRRTRTAARFSLPGPGAGALQGAAQGGAIAFGSAASFGEAEGAAPQSQYLASRSSGGWVTQNLTPPLLSGTYAGGAYLLFSEDLSRALLANGWRCRDGGVQCEAENPPLGEGAPAGYRNLYLRDFASGTYTPLITTANSPALTIAPEDFQLSLVSAKADLSAVLFSSCAALSAGSSEVPNGEGGCDPGSPNFYLWSEDGTLSETSPEEPPGGEVIGVLGASEDGSYLYYLTASGLYLDHDGAKTKIADGADPTNYPAATGTARVTPDGARLAFLSSEALTGYPNAGLSELFLYEAGPNKLRCVSCNPKGASPKGPSTIPGGLAAGDGPALYKPRALSEDGTRLFFDSEDALLAGDTDKARDVYQWQAKGVGGCAKAAGCLGLISSGRVGSAAFADASADGSDAFFLTAASLLGADTGSLDLYDARAGGGFPEASPPIPCLGDACQGPPSVPEDPLPGSALFVGHGNPVPPRAKRCTKRQRAKGKPKRCAKKKQGKGAKGKRGRR